MTSTDSFTIDDAFQSDDEDKVRLYGATNETSVAVAPKTRPDEMDRQLSSQPIIDDINSKGGNNSTSQLLRTQCSQSTTGLADDSEVSTRPNIDSISWLRHPRVRENWRVVMGAFALTLIGSALLLTGLVIVILPQRGIHSLVFFFGGLLCLIPGAYHLVYIYLAAKGCNGYSLYNLPVFR